MNFYVGDLVFLPDADKQMLMLGYVASKNTKSMVTKPIEAEAELTVGDLISKIATDDLTNASEINIESTINKILEAAGDKTSTSDFGNDIGTLQFDPEFSDSLILDDEEDLIYEIEPQAKSGDVFVSWWLQGKVMRSYNDDSAIEVSGSKLILYDRHCNLFDTVKYENSPMCGIITKFKKTCQLEILNQNALIMDVDFKNLKINHSDYGGLSYVIYNSWLGRLKKLSFDFIVKFNDGALLYVTEESLNEFDLFNSKMSLVEICDTEGLFEGSVLFGDARDLRSKKARFYKEGPIHNTVWLRNLRRKETVYVVIQKLVYYSASIEWIANRCNSDGNSPPTVLGKKEIAKLQFLTDVEHLDEFDSQFFVWNYELQKDDLLIYKDEDHLHVTEFTLYKLYKDGDNHGLHTERVSDKESDHQTVAFDLDSLLLQENYEKSLPKVLLPGSDSQRKPVVTIPKRGKLKQAVTLAERTRLKSTNSTSQEEDNSSTASPVKPSASAAAPKSNPNTHKFNDSKELFPLHAGVNVPVVILATQTKVQVTWQDGRVEDDVSTTNLILVDNFDEHDFYPGFFVSDKDEQRSESQYRYGTILSADNKERVCKVQWFDVPDSTSPDKVVKLGDPEEMGVYDIVNHTKYNYREAEYVLVDPDLYAEKDWPVGNISGFVPTEGKVILTFPDFSTSSIYPTQLLLTLSSYWQENATDDWSESEESSEPFESDESEWETENEEDIPTADDDYQKKIQDTLGKYIIPMLRLTRQSRSQINQMLEQTSLVFTSTPSATTLPPESQELFSRSSVMGLMNKMNFLRAQLVRVNFILKDERMGKQISALKFEEMTKKSWEKDSENIFKRIETFLNDQIGNKQVEAQIVQDFRQTLESKLQVTLQKVKCLEKFLIDWIVEKGKEVPKEASPSDILLKESTVDENAVTKDKSSVQSADPTMKGETEVSVSTQSSTLVETTDTLSPIGNSENGEEMIDQPLDSSEKKLNGTDDAEDMSLADSLKSPTFQAIPTNQRGILDVIESSPESHKYFDTAAAARGNSSQAFMRAWKRDIKLLSTSLPRGVLVKSFENRMDLFSVMIVGPAGTPYQHALFFFSIRLPPSYPNEPPKVHYDSLASERVNPNLYVDGNVCLSLLGTWMGKGTENWNSKTSNLLQLIVSLQGLILVPEPFYNEAGYESKRGTEELRDSSKRYNESAIINIAHSMSELIIKPIDIFHKEIIEHFTLHGEQYISLMRYWLSLTDHPNTSSTGSDATSNLCRDPRYPEFPLAPVTRGFQISLTRNITAFENAFNSVIQTKLSSE